MANMAVSRIKREFKEVMRSEEVSKKIFKNIKHAHTHSMRSNNFLYLAAHAPLE